MTEPTVLEEKIGEVIGLAMAAQVATEKVARLPDAEDAKSLLDQMNEEATETEERGTSLVDSMEGRKTAILEKARETKS
jgi:chromosome segregation and condensation protein ScpB